MRKFISIVYDTRPALLGVAGTVLLDRVSAIVGIAVGMMTLLYLGIRIWKELKNGKS